MAKYLIVGGVAGGATTAARLRRMDESAEIIMFERGEHISYANCGLPYYVGNVITERENLLLQTPNSFNKRLNVDVRINNEVIRIDRENKFVEVKDLATKNTYSETYDKLVVSPGAEPIKPPIPGIQDPAIFTVRNVKDTDKIKTYIEQNNPKKAVVVGAGFIGLEMAENLHHLGMMVSIVEMAEQVMTPIDFEMAATVHQHLKTKNVELYLKDGVSKFHRKENGLSIHLQSGKEINADLVILSIGVKPETKLIKDAGIELAPNGGIKVNKYLQTSDSNIYALGDAIAFPHPITGNYVNAYLAGPANKQGRILANNLVLGNKHTYKGAYATAIAKVFDLTIGSTGLAEKALKKEGIKYLSNITHGGSNAGYYPGAMPTTIKIMFDPTSGQLYGAQVVGYEGVDKRTDLIASVLQKGGTIYDLQEIEHAYAPPYSSAKDPVNQAGFTAGNIIEGLVNIIHWDEFDQLARTNLFVLDVRTPEEFELGNIEGAINIELDQIRNRLDEIAKDKKVIIYCGVGLRGYFAARILMQKGFADVVNLSGGYKIYEQATCEQTNENIFEAHSFDNNCNIDLEKANTTNMENKSEVKTIEIDACGLQCPGPIIKLKKEIDKLENGDRLLQKVTDQGFVKDVESWCNMTGNKLISVDSEKGIISALIEKQKKKESTIASGTGIAKNKTMVVFSDDMDRALASLVIANGAAATGNKVTLFFTFWGLNVIKKANKPKVQKDFMGTMFGKMMAGGVNDLKLSKMNMMGIGSKMMKKRMLSKKVNSLEDMLHTAMENDVEMIACQMSMDVMGVDKSELLDGVSIGGVATYLEEAEKSNINLFI